MKKKRVTLNLMMMMMKKLIKVTSLVFFGITGIVPPKSSTPLITRFLQYLRMSNGMEN